MRCSYNDVDTDRQIDRQTQSNRVGDMTHKVSPKAELLNLAHRSVHGALPD